MAWLPLALRRRPTVASRRLPVGGHTCRVLDSGGMRPAVVILASPLVTADSYRPTLAALAKHWRVVVVELPGSGDASRVRRPLTVAELAALVPPLLDMLALRRVQLLGHSNSGVIALEVARHHPARISRLILADATGAHPSASLGAVVAGRLWDGLLEWRLSLTGWPALAHNLLRHPRQFLAQLRLSASNLSLAMAPQVQRPTLLAWGARDHTMPLAAARRYLASLPQAQLVISPQGSHDWLIERPQEFARALADPGATGSLGRSR